MCDQPCNLVARFFGRILEKYGLILFQNLFKPRQRRLNVDMLTDFVSLIYNLKTVF